MPDPTDGGGLHGPRGRLPSRRRRLTLPAFALGAMSVGVAAFLVMLPTVSDACQPVTTPVDVSPKRVAAAIERRSDVLIIGDSYTAGRGSSSGKRGWAQDLVEERDWDADIDGNPGTGYLNAGASRGSSNTYLPRVEAHADEHPDLVIVQGSQNDWLAEGTALRAEVAQTLRQAKRQWPHAVVIALGPSAPYPRSEANDGIAAAVAAGATAAGVPFIDPLAESWFTAVNSGSFAARDGQHLNDAGYRYMALRVSSALDALALQAPGAQCR